MLGKGSEVVKPGSPWSWRLFTSRRKQFLQLLGLLSIILLLVACASLLLQIHWNRKLLLLRVSSPVSPLQADHPMNIAVPTSGHVHEGAGGFAALRRVADLPSAAAAQNSIRKAQRFFRAATAAATQGGVVLQWGDATIRLLRGAGIGEVFFLFYKPSEAPVPPIAESDEVTEKIPSEHHTNPLEVFKELAQEDRDEQLHQQLPFVAVPQQEMHRLSFFLPEYAEGVLPLAMVVRLDSGWTKFQAPPKAPYSLAAMKTFLTSYRRGEIAPLLRTEPLPPPTTDVDAVRSVVASNFSRSILEQTNYDSLVLLYTNWCGHCRRFQKNMQKLAEMFSAITSVAFFKMDVSRNDVPVPGLRVERVPHVVFFARDPEKSPYLAASVLPADAIKAARAAAAAAAESGDPTSSSWHVGEGAKRKKVVTFSHAEPDIVTYGKEFLLQHAFCESIDLQKGVDCNSVEGKDAEDL